MYPSRRIEYHSMRVLEKSTELLLAAKHDTAGNETYSEVNGLN